MSRGTDPTLPLQREFAASVFKRFWEANAASVNTLTTDDPTLGSKCTKAGQEIIR